jgi:hypothetical protein
MPPVPSMPSFTTCSASSAAELWCFLAVRKETFRAKAFYASLAATTLFSALLPLVVTGTASFGAAQKGCYVKTVVRLEAHFLGVDSPDYDPGWTVEGNFDDNAGWHLFPVHSFNTISTVVSLFGFGVWLFFSPHNSDVAQDLDRTLGRYFGLQWLRRRWARIAPCQRLLTVLHFSSTQARRSVCLSLERTSCVIGTCAKRRAS